MTESPQWHRLRGIVEIAVVQLGRDRTRTAVVVLGIALAVLAATTLASVGVGVLETGERKFDQSGRDLWITGGPVKLTPGSVGGIENQIRDAHVIEDELESRDAVRDATAMSFQTVYVSRDGESFETLVGAGAPATDAAVRITAGEGFTFGDPHYADGTYDRPMTREVVIDPQTAELLDAGVNDTLYIGGTIGAARDNEFRVVGISPTFSTFLGSPTVVFQLSELQEVTGTARTDSATIVTVNLREKANVQAVRDDIQATYPQYDVRTNREQLEATVERQAVVLASGASLIVFAAIAGVALTVNLLLSYVYQRRRTLAALKALGVSTSTLVGVTMVQTLLIGSIGGTIGITMSAAAIPLLNAVAGALVGFGDVVSVNHSILLVGLGQAVLTSIVAGGAASLRISGFQPLRELR